MAKKEKAEYQDGDCCVCLQLKKIIFKKEDFIIGVFTSSLLGKDKQKKECTCKGSIHNPVVGMKYRFHGRWMKDEVRGTWNFVFKISELFFDSGKEGFVKYLSTEVHGIGPRIAEAIYEKYGQDAFETLETNPVKVSQDIPGISPERAGEISAYLKKEAGIRDLRKRMYAIGLTHWQINTIIQQYGSDAERTLREDVFKLTEIKGLGFKRVSSIADMLEIPKDDPGRMRAAVIYAIDALMDDGHTCILGHEIICKAQELLDVKHANISAILEELVESGVLASEFSDPEKYIEDKQIFDELHMEEKIDKVFN